MTHTVTQYIYKGKDTPKAVLTFIDLSNTPMKRFKLVLYNLAIESSQMIF